MGIWKQRGEATTIIGRQRVVKYIYAKARLVYQAVRSCFLLGYWDNDDCWDNDQGWHN